MSRRNPWRSRFIAGTSALSLAAIGVFALPSNIVDAHADESSDERLSSAEFALASSGWIDVVGHAIELDTTPNTKAAADVSWDLTAMTMQNGYSPMVQSSGARVVIPASVPGPKTKDGKPTTINVGQPRYTNMSSDLEISGVTKYQTDPFALLINVLQDRATAYSQYSPDYLKHKNDPDSEKVREIFRENPQYLFTVFAHYSYPHPVRRADASYDDATLEKFYLTDPSGRLLLAQSVPIPLANGNSLIAFSAFPKETSDSWRIDDISDYGQFAPELSASADRTLYLGEVKLDGIGHAIGDVENFRAIGSAAPYVMKNPGDAKFNNVDLQELSDEAYPVFKPFLERILAEAKPGSELASYKLPDTVPLSAKALFYGSNIFPTEMVNITDSVSVVPLSVPAFPAATNACDPARAAWTTELPKIADVTWSKNDKGELIATAQGKNYFDLASTPRGATVSPDLKSVNYGVAPGAAQVCAVPSLLELNVPAVPKVFDLCGSNNAVWTVNLPQVQNMKWQRSATGDTLKLVAANGYYFNTNNLPAGVTLNADHTEADYGKAVDSDNACVPDKAAASGDKTLIPAPATPLVEQECGNAPTWGTLPEIPHLTWEKNADGSVSAIADDGYAFSASDLPAAAQLSENNTKLTFQLPVVQGSVCPPPADHVLPIPAQPEIWDRCQQSPSYSWSWVSSQPKVEHATWELLNTDENGRPTQDSIMILNADPGYVFTDEGVSSNVWRSPDGRTLSYGKVPGPLPACNALVPPVITNVNEDWGDVYYKHDEDLSPYPFRNTDLTFRQFTDTTGKKWWVSNFLVIKRLSATITAPMQVVDADQNIQMTTDLPADAKIQVPQQAFVDRNCRRDQSDTAWNCASLTEYSWGHGVTATANPDYVDPNTLNPNDPPRGSYRTRPPLSPDLAIPPQVEGAKGPYDYNADITRGILQTDPNADALTATSGIYGNQFCFVARQPENPWQAATTVPAIIANELFTSLGIDAKNSEFANLLSKLPNTGVSPTNRFLAGEELMTIPLTGQISGFNWMSNDGCDQAAAFVSLKALPKLPVPAAPAVNDPCGPGNATWSEQLPAIEHVTWKRSADGRKLSARASGGFKFSTENLPQGVTLSDDDTVANYGEAADSGAACTTPEKPKPQAQQKPAKPLAETGGTAGPLALVALLITAAGGAMLAINNRRRANNV